MCTVTLFRSEHRTIITMSRDERKDRPEGPFIQASTSSGVDFLHPTDTHSQGTWLGINARGIGACVLNRYGEKHLKDSNTIISRGSIIPGLLEAESLEQAYRKLDQLPLNHFRNFDLLLFSNDTILKCTHKNGHGMVKSSQENQLMLSSSSWNKVAVLNFRRTKFDNYLATTIPVIDYAESVLRDFHLSSIDDSRFEILMRRSESHTKSVSQIILDNDLIRFRYINEKMLDELSDSVPNQAVASVGAIYKLTRQ